MKIGHKDIKEVSDNSIASSIIQTVFKRLNCKKYLALSSYRYEMVKLFDIDEAISKFDEKIKGTAFVDLKHRENRIKNRDILIKIRDGVK